ncbi:peptide methionine sulfoxide reductase MsrA [Propionigenium maris DSM 9537]|uniref:Peptide methionine sulfoxide reductase MsrA n=1 Tax=Propionigenium maris DSM 9537 TaxID=1123000 RepID=A0A9W6GM09_9FUSO|nr:peptide-methionine (S)-S-oxide reductase MsrA [Propionigenium maris]GLI56893.1 peptide methionine sulfoxide reductase MsrA [Propionigenium maris DSM 9537]
MKDIVVAGGCFWGVEAYYKLIKGVVDTRVGYANGHKENPTYREVCTGTTGHAEVCRITYNEEIIDLRGILKYLFRIIDPTLLNRQGNDRGTQYRTGIYYKTEEEAREIEEYIEEISSSYSAPIVTEVLPLISFYDAEEYHQDYLTKNPGGYCHIDINEALK